MWSMTADSGKWLLMAGWCHRRGCLWLCSRLWHGAEVANPIRAACSVGAARFTLQATVMSVTVPKPGKRPAAVSAADGCQCLFMIAWQEGLPPSAAIQDLCQTPQICEGAHHDAAA